MITILIRVSLVLLVLNLSFPTSEAFGYFSSRTSSNGGYNEYNGYRDPSRAKTLVGTTSGLPSQNATRKGLGISAWGIVLVIVALVVAGMGFYYFSICYHICQPTKNKYDKMMLPTLA